MKKHIFLVSSLLLTSTVQASAQEAAAPTISEAPMTTDGAIGNNVNEPPSDLPAPEDRSWINKPLLITSGAVLLAGYVPALVISQTSDRPTDQTNLRYPVVGPWLNLTDRDCDDRACHNEETNKTLLIVDGIAQGVGALGVVLSLLLPGKTTQNWYLIGQTQVAPMYIANSVYGLGATGKF